MKYDVIALSVSVFLLILYYVYLGLRSRRHPETSVHALNAKLRERWVAMVMGSDKQDILAIQTLRNSVMAANFMASTSILLIIGTLNTGEKIGQWLIHWHPHQLGEQFSSDGWQIKLSLLLLVFAVAFFCFSMAIRFFNHVGYMINLSTDGAIDPLLFQQTCAYLNRAGRYYTYGTRSFFISLPLILWFFGAYFLVAATAGLIVGLAVLDRVPE
ncbi:MAG: DUF599 domain-containing protein [Methylococcales bacterium]|nr:DUF599 domain-containing protein [Methylococcales bacterium]